MINEFKETYYTCNLREPYYGWILEGKKIIEGRVRRGKWGLMKKGDIIVFNNASQEKGLQDQMILKITGTVEAHSFGSLWDRYKDRLLPGYTTAEEAEFLYGGFFPEYEKGQVIGIKLEFPACKMRISDISIGGRYQIDQSDQGTEDWHSVRNRLRITGSKFGVLYGVNRKKLPTEWLSNKKEFTKIELDRMEAGRLLEDPVRQWFLHSRYYSEIRSSHPNVETKEVGIAVPTWNSFIGVSLDGLIGQWKDKIFEPLYIIEIKTTARISNKLIVNLEPTIEEAREAVPIAHYGQMQGGMKVFGVSLCYYIVYGRTDNKIAVLKIQFDRDYWYRELYPQIMVHCGF